MEDICTGVLTFTAYETSFAIGQTLACKAMLRFFNYADLESAHFKCVYSRIYLFFELYVPLETEMISIHVEILLHQCIMHKHWKLLRYGEVTEGHHLFTDVDNS